MKRPHKPPGYFISKYNKLSPEAKKLVKEVGKVIPDYLQLRFNQIASKLSDLYYQLTLEDVENMIKLESACGNRIRVKELLSRRKEELLRLTALE